VTDGFVTLKNEAGEALAAGTDIADAVGGLVVEKILEAEDMGEMAFAIGFVDAVDMAEVSGAATVVNEVDGEAVFVEADEANGAAALSFEVMVDVDVVCCGSTDLE